MKAVCVLVCLALANGISASIFKKNRQPDDELIVQPLDYINQYQRPLYQPQEQTYKQYILSQKRYKQKPQVPVFSQESSQESQEAVRSLRKFVTVNSDYKTPRGQKWGKPAYTSFMKVQGDQPAYGDYIWSIPSMPIGYNDNTYTEQKKIEKILTEAQNVLTHPTTEEKVKFNQAVAAAEQTPNEDLVLNTTELLKKYKYPVEEHTIKTDDGYLLTVFHIPAKQQQIRDVTKKPVVFMMHGLLGSSDDWLLMGPGKSLAYLLSDAGYDVWLGNARGNKYSRRHVAKHPALNDFWQFSNDEVALHDLPAMIDYVLETTGQEKLQYVGHGQGTTAVFALAATRPIYNKKIAMIHALSPMVYMNNVRSPLIRMLAPNTEFEERLHHQIGHGAFKPSPEVISSVGGDMLETEIGSKKVGSNVYYAMSGVNIANVEPALMPVIMSHLPTGASTRMMRQYGQAVASDAFRWFDYGPVMNEQVYGSTKAPRYRMEAVEAPVSMYYSEADWLAQPADVARLQAELPHLVSSYKIPTDAHFAHMDFQFSTKAPELVYKRIIDSMTNVSY